MQAFNDSRRGKGDRHVAFTSNAANDGSRGDEPVPLSAPLLAIHLFAIVLVVNTFGSLPCLADDRPNIVLIFTDDQGFHDVGCYGSEIPTPRIDSLARDGLKFTQWYSASSICTPSRFGLLTGLNPCRSRDRLLGALMFLADADKTRGLHAAETTIASRLKRVGYRTALVGKWHLGHGGSEFLPTRHGFDSFYGHTGGCVDFYTMRYGNSPDWYRNESLVDVTGYATNVITDEAVDFLKRQDGSQPFFLYLSYNAPHFGKGWNDGEGQTVNQLQPPPDDLARVGHIKDITRRKYAAKVVNLDDAVGRVLEKLDEAKLTDRTLVIFITDHGGDPVYGGANDPLRGGKASLFEGGIRVPCLMRWPGVISAGSTTNARAWSIDLAPTLCSVCGVEFRGPTDGMDLSPTLRGEAVDLAQREMYWELGTHDELGRGQWTALRQGDWKYLSDSEGQEYLFHIASDQREQNNRIRDQADLASELRERTRVLSRQYAELQQ